jgi:2',3'-cyclic-nucleotide 2'-phosphodiesterase (5'-nucleotidase family)
VDIFAPATTRRRFLRLLGQGALLAALPAPLRAGDAATVTISVLHTTDLHGHILPTVDYAGHSTSATFTRAPKSACTRAAPP